MAPEEGGERWEESFCCYVHWESPVWRVCRWGDLRADLHFDMASLMVNNVLTPEASQKYTLSNLGSPCISHIYTLHFCHSENY